MRLGRTIPGPSTDDVPVVCRVAPTGQSHSGSYAEASGTEAK